MFVVLLLVAMIAVIIDLQIYNFNTFKINWIQSNNKCDNCNDLVSLIRLLSPNLGFHQDFPHSVSLCFFATLAFRSVILDLLYWSLLPCNFNVNYLSIKSLLRFANQWRCQFEQFSLTLVSLVLWSGTPDYCQVSFAFAITDNSWTLGMSTSLGYFRSERFTLEMCFNIVFLRFRNLHQCLFCLYNSTTIPKLLECHSIWVNLFIPMSSICLVSFALRKHMTFPELWNVIRSG